MAMRKIRKGVIHLPHNGVLVPVPASSNRGRQVAHVAGLTTGEVANVVATPFMLVYDGLAALAGTVRDSQYGQSVQYGWHKAEHRKQVMAAAVRNRRNDVSTMREGLKASGWQNVDGMSDSQVCRAWARHTNQFSYIQPETYDYRGIPAEESEDLEEVPEGFAYA